MDAARVLPGMTNLYLLPGAAAGLNPAMAAAIPGQVWAEPVIQYGVHQNLPLQESCPSQQTHIDEKEISDKAKEIQARFKLDDRITRDLVSQMKRRQDTFRDDLPALWEILGGARNPAGLLRVKLREMEDGTFRGTLTPDRDVEELAKKFNLDAQAAAKLAEVLTRRADRKKDLRQLQKHLELSNRPSSLVMLMLKDMRAGLPIKDPEYPPAVGSLVQKRGFKVKRSRSRTRRRAESTSSSPLRSPVRSHGAGPDPRKVAPARGPRPQTLLERFG